MLKDLTDTASAERQIEETRREASEALDRVKASPARCSFLRPLVKAMGTAPFRFVDSIPDSLFRYVESDDTVEFSRSKLSTICARIVDAGICGTADDLKECLRLLTYHECLHIPQGMVAKQDVWSIKRAFGPDLVGRLDLVADLDAAHSAVAVQLSPFSDDDYRNAYVAALAKKLDHSIELLLRVFPITGKDEKKRRALGLVRARALCDIDLPLKQKLERVMTPFNVGVDPERRELWIVEPNDRRIRPIRDRPDQVMSLYDGLEIDAPDILVGKMKSVLGIV